jgi:hypothetical protein
VTEIERRLLALLEQALTILPRYPSGADLNSEVIERFCDALRRGDSAEALADADDLAAVLAAIKAMLEQLKIVH